jgi:mRNA interferase MazF
LRAGGSSTGVGLSPKEYNHKSRVAILCPITNQKKGYPFEVELPENCEVSGVILADHLKSLDWQNQKAAFVTKLPQAVIADVLARIKPLLQL